MEKTITDQSITQLIEKGEMAREHGNYPESLRFLDEALIAAGDSEKPEYIIAVLGHRLLIYKHLAEQTGKATYSELMYGDTIVGMQLINQFKITGSAKAVMLLRQGDYFLAKKDHALAVNLYGQAIGLLDQSHKGQYAEYLAYYGLALVMDGKKDEGLPRIDEALKLAEESTDLRPFHKLVVLSGMHIRYVQAYEVIDDMQKARQHLKKASDIAQELAQNHDIHTRLDQVKRLRQKIKLKL